MATRAHLTENFYRRFGFEPLSGYEERYMKGLRHLTLGLWLYPKASVATRYALRAYVGQLSLEPGLLGD